MLDCEAGVERSVRARVAAAWGRWRKVSSLVVNRSIDLKTRGRVVEACVRSALLYGTETWALTDRLMDVLQRCDCKMLKYMAGVKWQDGKSSIDVRDVCGMEDLFVKMRQRRLRFLGHVRSEESLLNEVEEMRIGGRRRAGRPKKKWRACLAEDMSTLGVKEYMAHDRQLWKAVITRPTPP